MPLPKLKQNEDKEIFISRCMSNEIIKSDYPNNQQRIAVCFFLFKKYSKKD